MSSSDMPLGSGPTLDPSPSAGDFATSLSSSPRIAPSTTALPQDGPGCDAGLQSSGGSGGGSGITPHALTSWPSGSSTGEDERGSGAAGGHSTLTQWLPGTSKGLVEQQEAAAAASSSQPPSPSSLTFDSPFSLRTTAPAPAAAPLAHASSYEAALAALAGSQSYTPAAAYSSSSPAAGSMVLFELPPISGRSSPRSDGFASGGLLSMLPVPPPPPAYEDAGLYSNVLEATPLPPPPYDEAGEYPTLEVAGGGEDSGLEEASSR